MKYHIVRKLTPAQELLFWACFTGRMLMVAALVAMGGAVLLHVLRAWVGGVL